MGSDIPAGCIATVRGKNPLVHHITNYVTANDCANIVLALGASPVMADDFAEAAQITAAASALAINIGTLSERTVRSMLESGKTANSLGIPSIFDPVGAGASEMRSRTAETLLASIKFSIINGNVSEIFHIFRGSSLTKGVDAGKLDSGASLAEISRAARGVSQKYGCVVAVTGPVDVIADGDMVWTISNGRPEMGRVTGSGCMCASLAACFLGAGLKPHLAALCGIALMGTAGEIAFENAPGSGTGSLRTGMIDAVCRITDEEFIRRARITCMEI